MTRLTGVIGRYPHTQALLERPVTLADGTTIEFVTPDRAGGAVGFVSRMLRAVAGFDFDVCELPLVNYLAAKEQGASFTALPIVLTRRFPHPLLIGNRRRGITTPADLEDKRVGISYYGNTDGTWARGLLGERYGVDLRRVTWVTTFEEQVAGARVPPNTIHLPRVDLVQMLVNDELDGQVIPPTHLPADPDLVTLVGDTEHEQRAWYELTGVFPPLHTVVVKDPVWRQHATIAPDLFDRFVRAKDKALAAIAPERDLDEAARRQALTTGFAAHLAGRAYLGPHPLQYGLPANTTALEMLIGMCFDQGILAEEFALRDLFLPISR